MPSGKQYIPVENAKFYPWQGNLVNIVVINAPAWGIPAPNVAALVARRAAYEPLYVKASIKETRTPTDVLAHRQMRQVYEFRPSRSWNSCRSAAATLNPVAG